MYKKTDSNRFSYSFYDSCEKCKNKCTDYLDGRIESKITTRTIVTVPKRDANKLSRTDIGLDINIHINGALLCKTSTK